MGDFGVFERDFDESLDEESLDDESLVEDPPDDEPPDADVELPPSADFFDSGLGVAGEVAVVLPRLSVR
ncbi:MAG TPA: hypothetical protein VES03_10480 [Motilibacterales bacterium]|nr:hypothetical protein [Motilibacterales bacterium]